MSSILLNKLGLFASVLSLTVSLVAIFGILKVKKPQSKLHFLGVIDSFCIPLFITGTALLVLKFDVLSTLKFASVVAFYLFTSPIVTFSIMRLSLKYSGKS